MPAFLSLLLLDPRFRKPRLVAAFIIYALIVGLGSIRGVRADIGNYASGLVLHSVAYAGITVLLFTGIDGSARKRALLAVLTVAAMGAVDELVQSFLPYRHGSIRDWMVDCNAAVLTAALLWAVLPMRAPSR